MKHSFFFGVVCGLLSSAFVFGQDDLSTEDYGSETINAPADNPTTKKTPFSFTTYIDGIGGAKIKNGYYKKDTIEFAVANVDAGMIVYYSPCYEEGARVSLSYNANYLHWRENPLFSQDHFNTASLNLGAFTGRFENWFWKAQLSFNMDASQWTSEYLSYDTLLWGRYSYSTCTNLHIGVLALTGLDMVWIYPIIGFDWKISERWKLNAVYPLNMSLEYALNQRWSLAVGARNFDVRHRVKPHESYSKALVRYRNSGAEFMVKYDKDSLTANLHAGIAFLGRYRVANKNNHHAHTYRLASSGYAGGEIAVKF